jgi:uncharacterized protein (TIRG00374 family)
LIFGYTVSLVLTIASLAPETPGVVEGSMAIVFSGLGFPAHITVLSILLFRIFSYWLPLPLGIVAYFKMKKSGDKDVLLK